MIRKVLTVAGNASTILTSRAYHNYRLASNLSFGQNLPLQSMQTASLRAGMNLPSQPNFNLPSSLHQSLSLPSSLQAGKDLPSSLKMALNLPQSLQTGQASLHPRPSSGVLQGHMYPSVRFPSTVGLPPGGLGGLGPSSLHLSSLGGGRSVGGFSLQQFALQQQQQQQHAFQLTSRHSEYSSGI